VIAALLVAVGAAVGAPARYAVNHLMRARWGATPMAGTLVVNVLGSFALGLLVGAAVSGSWLALLGTGFCGALTTFSTLALEIHESLADDRRTHAVANVVLTLVLGLGAAYLGLVLAS
jgi:CrcB protein